MKIRSATPLRLRGLLPPLLALLVACPAQAAEGGVRDLVFQLINFVIFVGALVFFARKPIQSYFANRRTSIRAELEEASGLLQAAESRYADWQRKLIDLQQETERIRNDGIRHAEEDAAKIVADAQAAAERIHRDAEAVVEQELRRARGELRAEAAALATEMAERILRERLIDSDRERLLDEFIVGVEPSGRRPN